ncbi:MAG TPA: cell division protein ZapE [Methylocella sp.]|nr:cell division protein ZapE [Methylocella sp.]
MFTSELRPLDQVDFQHAEGLLQGQALFLRRELSASLLDLYAERTRRLELERDEAQEDVVRRLEDLRLSLAASPRPSKGLGWLSGPSRKAAPIAGLYIWGEAGRGKTMLMDLFYDAAPVARKTRVHFHAFMAQVHAVIHEWRQQRRSGRVIGDDPVAAVAYGILQKATLLCFDEFSVTDIADAMLLGRLFEALFAGGMVIVATANVRPDLLYQNGLNRALFLPFIAMIEEKMQVLNLAARTDYRLRKLRDQAVYLVPADAAAKAALTQAFARLTGVAEGAPINLEVLGRTLAVPQAHANVARFTFVDLCRQPLGGADFIALAQRFHTLILDAIPILKSEERNEAKRFITLIDTLYDRHVKLIASAEAEPNELFQGQDGFVAFEFKRTVSRLFEMRSLDYLALPHGPVASFGSGDTSGLVET